jgi:signal transduction histidine kinase
MRTELEWAMVRPRSPEETGTTLTSLHHQVARLVGLCNALLDLEELRSAAPAVTGTADLGRVAAEVSERFAVQAAHAGREIHDRVAGEVTIAGNARWLELAVGNLVSNALRYGSGDVSIRVDGGQDAVRVAVSDEGPGFPPEFEAQAFDRFSRADASRSTVGTGLGLAIVRAVAEAHGGTAAIAGAEVSLTLPRRPAGPPAPQQDVSSRARRTTA